MKEKLPIDFITNFVSKGWDEVGNLKASSEAIKREFKDTNEITNIIQDLIDAYLVALGQMELHLDKKDYLDIPTEKELKESINNAKAADGKMDTEWHSNKLTLNEEDELEEDVLVDIQLKDEDNFDLENTVLEDKVQAAIEDEIENKNISDKSEITIGKRIVDELNIPDEYTDSEEDDKKLPAEQFDYFVDFDDADISKEEAENIRNYRLGM